MKFDVEEYARMKRHFCGPDWRWKLARARVSSVSTGLIDEADQQVREVVDYLSQRAGGPDEKERAAQEFPHIAAAELLAEDSAGCGELKILVLGGCSPAEIGERLELDTTVLATWENLFFDVRAARGATDWILVKVIRPEQERGDQRLASKLKFAYAGGPLAAAAILDADSRVSLRQGVALFDKRIHLHLKCDQAAEVPLDTDRKKLF